jgi:hypothetical protein
MLCFKCTILISAWTTRKIEISGKSERIERRRNDPTPRSGKCPQHTHNKNGSPAEFHLGAPGNMPRARPGEKEG